jgi:hypothetical protein
MPQSPGVALSLHPNGIAAPPVSTFRWIDAGVETVIRVVASAGALRLRSAVAAAGDNVDPETDFAGTPI